MNNVSTTTTTTATATATKQSEAMRREARRSKEELQQYNTIIPSINIDIIQKES